MSFTDDRAGSGVKSSCGRAGRINFVGTGVVISVYRRFNGRERCDCWNGNDTHAGGEQSLMDLGVPGGVMDPDGSGRLVMSGVGRKFNDRVHIQDIENRFYHRRDLGLSVSYVPKRGDRAIGGHLSNLGPPPDDYVSMTHEEYDGNAFGNDRWPIDWRPANVTEASKHICALVPNREHVKQVLLVNHGNIFKGGNIGTAGGHARICKIVTPGSVHVWPHVSV